MDPLSQLRARWMDVKALQRASALLSWDQQVLMPPGGAPARAEHSARLASMAHKAATSDELLRSLEAAEAAAEPGTDAAAEARVVRREVDRMTRLPAELVARKSRTAAAGYLDWRTARQDSNFALMVPHYEELFLIARETSQALGPADHPYDPLLDSFEEGAKTTDVERMFEDLHAPTQQIIEEMRERKAPDVNLLVGDPESLRAWVEGVIRGIGFDFSRGRLDTTTNAFCTTISCGDVRMTARPQADMKGVVFSALHEMGHGLYEQNSPPEWEGSPLGGGISLGVHESQSRLWENIVGRSAAFWRCHLGSFQSAFPAVGSPSGDEFAMAVSWVKPGPIRIGSDEVTYNLHIRVRFECEVALVTKQIGVKDLPEFWNSRMRSLLGVTPKNDGEGVLQDVHWSRGSVGYFPTYAMGNLIGWQMWETLTGDLGDPSLLIEKGDFAPILGWLTDKVYRQAKRFPPRDLVMRVTGKPMEAGAFVRGMKAKFGIS